MFLQYNGINLQIEHFVLWEQRKVFTPDNADELYTHYHFGVMCYFNPFATASVPVIGEEGGFSGLAGNAAPQSMLALREKLMQHRKLLIVNFPVLNIVPPGTGTNVVASPLTAGGTKLAAGGSQSGVLNVDCANGPHVIAVNVLGVEGIKTWRVYFEVETWLRENQTWYNWSLLSARWKQTQTISEDFLTTRTVEGTAFFRKDSLVDTTIPGHPLVPDDFRSLLFHPIPPNCKRENIQVTASEDGLALSWSFDDVEQWINIAYKGVSRFKGGFGYSTDRTGGFTGLILPGRTATVSMQIWGLQGCTRKNLLAALFQAIGAYGLTMANDATKVLTAESYRFDMVQPYLEFEWHGVIRSGSILQWGVWMAGQLGLGAGKIPKVVDQMPGFAVLDPTQANPAPPNDPGAVGPCRGFMVASCAAQILTDAGDMNLGVTAEAASRSIGNRAAIAK